MAWITRIMMMSRQTWKLYSLCSTQQRYISTTKVLSCYDKVLTDTKKKAARGEVDTDPNYMTAIAREERRRAYGKIKSKAARELSLPKEDRVLTRDMMDQIRFLKQEDPDEWTISRLAESFGVSQTTIIKTLKSRFVPNEKRKTKQDKVAKANYDSLPAGNQDTYRPSLQPGKKINKDEMKIVNVARSQNMNGDAMVSQLKKDRSIGTFTKIALTSDAVVQKLQNMEVQDKEDDSEDIDHNVRLRREAITEMHAEAKTFSESVDNVTDVMDENEQEKQGVVQDIDESIPIFTDPHIDDKEYNFNLKDLRFVKREPMKIIRRGNRFYDSEGNFLYRI
ncbi:neugrin-like [Glandiceps talaboti]